MKNSILYVLSGVSGSGKSTLTKKMLSENPNLRSVGRDKIREMMFGYSEETVHKYYTDHNLGVTELQVSKVQNDIIKSFIKQGFDVVIDNTHLRLSYINRVIKDFNQCVIKFVLVEADYDTCVARDKARKRSVGEDVIKKQFRELKDLKNNFNFETYAPKGVEYIIQNSDLPKCVVWDLDGNLCLHTSNRSPFEYHRLLEDTLCEPVYEAFLAYKCLGYKAVICSGREGFNSVIEDTRIWLSSHNIEFDELHLRKEGDHRPDYIVKEELWRDIANRFNITACYDDRTQVIEAGRRLGLKMFQSEAGDF